jgi:hypothetical protein
MEAIRIPVSAPFAFMKPKHCKIFLLFFHEIISPTLKQLNNSAPSK